LHFPHQEEEAVQARGLGYAEIHGAKELLEKRGEGGIEYLARWYKAATADLLAEKVTYRVLRGKGIQIEAFYSQNLLGRVDIRN